MICWASTCHGLPDLRDPLSPRASQPLMAAVEWLWGLPARRCTLSELRDHYQPLIGHEITLGELPLASAALFDLGVYLTVVGATLLTVSVLGNASRDTAPSATTGATS